MKSIKALVPIILMIAVTTSCTSSPPSPTPEPITLQYIGHSCVVITAPDGTRIVSDPYQSYQAPREIAQFPGGIEADAVTISHFHPDHANVTDIVGEPQIVYEPGSYEIGTVKITSYESDHGLANDAPSGQNTAFVFQIGDVKIAHMGGAGIVTQEELLDAIQGIDVILIDIQGDATHPLEEMIDQMQQINARTIIPTHYSISEERRFYGGATVEEFIELLPAEIPVVREGSQIQVTPNMPTQAVVLTPLAHGE